MIPIRLAVVLALVVSAATARVLSGKELRVRGPLSQQRDSLGIHGGKTTTIQKHPYLVSLQFLGAVFCAATILSRKWALTTAGCIHEIPISGLTVVANSPDGTQGTVYNLKQYIIHPKFDSYSNDYDVGAIQIAGKFKWSKTARPVRLPRKQPKVNSLLNVAGYGSSDYVGYKLGGGLGLREAWMPWSSNQICDSYYGRWYNMTPRQACSYGNGTTTLCTGDFADGFVKNGVIYGMFSDVDLNHECDPTWPIILSNIQPLTGWIRAITGAKYEDE